MSESDAVGLVLRFPQPSKPVSQNAWNSLMYGNGGSRHVASRERDAWKEAAFYAWKSHRYGPVGAVLGQPCTVRIGLEFHENRTRDPHNYPGDYIERYGLPAIEDLQCLWEALHDYECQLQKQDLWSIVWECAAKRDAVDGSAHRDLAPVLREICGARTNPDHGDRCAAREIPIGSALQSSQDGLHSTLTDTWWTQPYASGPACGSWDLRAIGMGSELRQVPELAEGTRRDRVVGVRAEDIRVPGEARESDLHAGLPSGVAERDDRVARGQGVDGQRLASEAEAVREVLPRGDAGTDRRAGVSEHCALCLLDDLYVGVTIGTVCKWIVDGLVLAHVWPDDNPRWVSVAEPTLHVRNDKPKDAPLSCTIEFELRDGAH